MAAPSTHIKIPADSTWHQVNGMFTKISGTWREIDTAWTKRSGVWRQVYSLITGPTVVTGTGYAAGQIYGNNSPNFGRADYVGNIDGSLGYCWPCVGGCVAGGCYPLYAATGLTVKTLGYDGAGGLYKLPYYPDPGNAGLIKNEPQTASWFLSSSPIDAGYFIWYNIISPPFTPSGWVNVAGIFHAPAGPGSLSGSGTFGINVPASRLVIFAYSAGPAWNGFAGGFASLTFPNP